MTMDDPEVGERFNRVLGATVEALEGTGVRYAFIGGIASGGLGRPRSTYDIDLFVMPDDAEVALRELEKHGFRVERTDPSWLFKGFKEGILVDVIFKSKGEIYLDLEMYQRLITAEFHGKQLRLVAPEDLLIIKAAAHSELTPGHWHDAIGLLSHANFDWNYLIKRAKRAPRRVLSLLLYAQSADVWVPNHVIHELFEGLFGYRGEAESPRPSRHGSLERTPVAAPVATPAPTASSPLPSSPSSGGERPVPRGPAPQFPSQFADPKVAQAYVIPHLRECLAEDGRTHELDILIEQMENRILLRGDVCSQARKDNVEQITRECYPMLLIENQLRVLCSDEPTGAEEVQ
jgi:predicted nucleotidyltransferase